MMKKIYYLSTCDTCARIIRRLGGLEGFEKQDIKNDRISAGQLAEMKKLAGSFEILFSRRAVLYKERKLKDVKLEEEDYKRLILEEYTFLKRPVIIIGRKIFVGNEEKVIASAEEALGLK